MAVLNVRDSAFGAIGDGIADDTLAIQRTIQKAATSGGGIVYVPIGNYPVSNTLVVSGHNIHLVGEGWGSRLIAQGAFDTISINPSSPSQTDNTIEDIYFVEVLKTGGKTIVAQRVSQLRIVGATIEGPFDGIHIHNFNDCKVVRTRVAGPRGTYGCWLSGGGKFDDGRSDVIDFYDTVFEGSQSPLPHDRHGLIVDGAVSTVSAHKLYFIAVNGAGLWVRNNIEAKAAPQFMTIYGLEADFPRYEGIRLERGQRFYFTDTQIHGSKTRTNVLIDEPVNTVSFKGGFSSGAHLAGMDIFGRQISVESMDFLANSGIEAGLWAGIVLEDSSRMVTVSGNKCGDPHNVTQSFGIQINTRADQFAVTGNVLFHNVKGGLLNGAGTGPSKVAAFNATQ